MSRRLSYGANGRLWSRRGEKSCREFHTCSIITTWVGRISQTWEVLLIMLVQAHSPPVAIVYGVTGGILWVFLHTLSQIYCTSFLHWLHQNKCQNKSVFEHFCKFYLNAVKTRMLSLATYCFYFSPVGFCDPLKICKDLSKVTPWSFYMHNTHKYLPLPREWESGKESQSTHFSQCFFTTAVLFFPEANCGTAISLKSLVPSLSLSYTHSLISFHFRCLEKLPVLTRPLELKDEELCHYAAVTALHLPICAHHSGW